MAVSRRLRFEVLRRDDHTCRYCGAKAPGVALTVDHVIPTALGGTDDPTNLVTACAPCNGGKSSVGPSDALVADVAADALRLRAALERVAEERRQEIADTAETLDWFADLWNGWTWVDSDGARRTIPIASDWPTAIERFVSLTLDRTELEYFVRIAMKAKVTLEARWRYFCGCCWREITRRQEAAKDALTSDADVDEIDTETAEYRAGFDDGWAARREVTAHSPVIEQEGDAWGDPLAGDPLAGDPAEGGE